MTNIDAASTVTPLRSGQSTWSFAHSESMEPQVRQLHPNMEQALAGKAPELFVDFVSWLGRAGPPRGLTIPHIEAELAALRVEMAEREGPDGTAVHCVDEALGALRRIAGSDETFALDEDVSDAHGLVDLRRRYLGLLFAGLRRDALNLLDQAVDAGTAPDRLYLGVLAPALHEVGWLWQAGRASVAQEHFCTAVTQYAMARISGRATPRGWNGRTAVLAAAGGERHDMGLRMIADLLDQRGWSAVVLGADVPAREIPMALRNHRADLLGLSCTLIAHLDEVREATRAVRADAQLSDLPILVGGRPFAVAPKLWRRVGADATGADGADAVTAADRLVPSASPLQRHAR